MYMRINEITADKPTFNVTSQSGFRNGFTVTMVYDGTTVGHYKYSNTDDGPYHDVSILPMYRNQGYGKMLTLKAIATAGDYEDIGGYAMDTLGQTKDMERVYDSLLKNGLVDGGLGELHLTDKGWETLEDFEEWPVKYITLDKRHTLFKRGYSHAFLLTPDDYWYDFQNALYVAFPNMLHSDNTYVTKTRRPTKRQLEESHLGYDVPPSIYMYIGFNDASTVTLMMLKHPELFD